MQVYEGMSAVRGVLPSISGTELGAVIGRRVDELSEYLEVDDPSFLRVIILEPVDVLTALNDALGFSLFERNCDVIESHEEWFELTLVLSDDGAGVIIYIPKSLTVDPGLFSYCHKQMELLSS
ncbi:hypothetical protein [Comamonas sp. C24C]